MDSTSPAPSVGVVGGSHPLDKLFCPRSIAVLGATKTPGTVPYDCFHNIAFSGYTGTLYPIAPGKRSICAIPAHRYVTDIQDDIDLAVIILPANCCHLGLEQCGQKGIKSVIMISAGFREVGEEGAKREARIREIKDRYGINLIGPNCFGMINADPAVGMNASFSKKMPAHGSIGFLSQSGGMCAAALDYALAHDIGFTKFVSFGNKIGVSEVDLLSYLHQDPQTKVIMMYLEELGVNGRKLIEAARKVTRGPNAKPIVAIKSGRTSAGATAAASHTGSRASDDAIVDGVFREAGMIRAYTFQQLFDLATMLAYQPMPKGNRLAIITNTGGPGVLATDAVTIAGELQMAKFLPETTKQLKESVPATASVKNPVDVLGDGRSERYEQCLGLSLGDPNADQAIVILTPHSMTDVEDIAKSCKKVADKLGKPVACSFMGGADVDSAVKWLLKNKMPHFLMPEYAASVMADIQRIQRWQATSENGLPTPKVDKAAADVVLKGRSGQVPADVAMSVLKAYGLPVAAGQGGQQLVLGGRQDATFGPVIMFGVSDDLVRAFGDVAYSLAPLLAGAAGRMIRGVKGLKLLDPSVKIEAIADCLERLGQLMADLGDVARVDLGVLAGPGGLALADVNMVMKN